MDRKLPSSILYICQIVSVILIFIPIKLFLLLLITAIAYSADGEETDDPFEQSPTTLISRELNPAKGVTI